LQFYVIIVFLQLQSALQQSQSGALEMQSQLQSMTEEICILQTSKDRVSFNPCFIFAAKANYLITCWCQQSATAISCCNL